MLAHQGGWDEFLYAAVPIALIAWLLRVATTRAKKQQALSDTNSDAESVTTDESD